jgi:SAM-dependent methyltransferase
MAYPGLDDAFLRYISATPENLRRIQSFYLPFFLGRQGPVVDLACGHGDFVQLLNENEVAALGVDSDPACCAEATRRGVDVLCGDVFTWLEEIADESLSGIFSAHLVEHLPYERVMALIQLAHRALEPGGIILLTTPNVRGLYPHLESFYMHFGHVTFYHPKLLCFFLEHLGFSNPRMGENPRMAHPLWRNATWTNPDEQVTWSGERSASATLVGYEPTIPSKVGGAVGRAISAAKTHVARLLVRPLLDQAIDEINEALEELRHYVSQLNANVNDTHRRLMELDRSVECYVYATKGDVGLDLPPRLMGEAP